jgi:hypothetical protein
MSDMATPTSSSSDPPATTATAQTRDPLHGITLEAMLNALVAHFGWAYSRPLFRAGSERDIKPQVFTQDAVGTRKS